MVSSSGFGVKALNSMAFVGSAQAIRLVLSTAATIIVARMLSPDDYGVVAMAAPVTGFILMFQDLGLGQATVQAKDVSHEQLTGAFWMNILATIIIAGVLLALAPLVSWFYQDSRPGLVVAASVLPALVSGAAIQNSALLNRHMRFGAISVIDVVSAFAVFIATIATAAVLRSYWALWAGSLVGSFTSASLVFRLERWRPGGPGLKGTSEMAKFGGNLTGASIFNYLVRNLDNVLIARFRGPSELGLYDRGYRLMMLPLENINAPVSRVMVPVLSRLMDSPERYKRAFLLATRGVLTAALPGIAVAAALSGQVVPLLLGSKWQAASPIFFWLSLMGLVQPLGNVTGWLFISSGRARQMFRWSLGSSIFTAIGFGIGIVGWGAEGVAASLFLTSLARLPFLLAYSSAGTPVRTGDLWMALIEPAIIVAITWSLAVALRGILTGWPLLIGTLAVAYITAMSVSLCTPGGRGLVRLLITHGTARLPRFRRQAAT